MSFAQTVLDYHCETLRKVVTSVSRPVSFVTSNCTTGSRSSDEGLCGACANTSYFTRFCNPVQSICGSSWMASENGFHWNLATMTQCAQAPLTRNAQLPSRLLICRHSIPLNSVLQVYWVPMNEGVGGAYMYSTTTRTMVTGVIAQFIWSSDQNHLPAQHLSTDAATNGFCRLGSISLPISLPKLLHCDGASGSVRMGKFVHRWGMQENHYLKKKLLKTA